MLRPNVFSFSFFFTPQFFLSDTKLWINFKCILFPLTFYKWIRKRFRKYPRDTNFTYQQTRKSLSTQKTFDLILTLFSLPCIISLRIQKRLTLYISPCMCRRATMIIQSSYNLSTKQLNNFDGHIGFGILPFVLFSLHFLFHLNTCV